jgi:hypothetical protein
MLLAKPPYIIKVKKLWGNTRGFAFWPFIFVVDTADKVLLQHEMVHIRQQLDGWLIGFYIKYLYYQWKYGYWNNPYEVEARKIAGE